MKNQFVETRRRVLHGVALAAALCAVHGTALAADPLKIDVEAAVAIRRVNKALSVGRHAGKIFGACLIC